MTALSAKEEPAGLARGAAGATTGDVTAILRLEGLAALLAAVLAYSHFDGNWLAFALLFLIPDLSMLGYLVDRATGAVAYNAGHTYLSPALLALIGFAAGAPLLYGPALIWVAHIGFDRLLGYGLKYPAGFGATHLGLKGQAAMTDAAASTQRSVGGSALLWAAIVVRRRWLGAAGG